MGSVLETYRYRLGVLVCSARAMQWASAIRASFFSVALTASRVFSSLFFNKLVAVYFGPSGLALVGQFQNFTAVVFGITTGNITNAVVSLVAGAKTDEGRRKAVCTSLLLLAGGTAVVAFLVGLLAEPLSLVILSNRFGAGVFQTLALLMVPLIVNVTVLAVAAGLGHTQAYIIINFFTAVLLAPVAYLMINWHGLPGALLSAALTNAVAIAFSAIWLLKWRPFPLRWIWSGLDANTARSLAKLTSLTASTIVMIPLCQYAVRSLVVRYAGEDSGGQWQAALKVGEVILMIGTVMISVYLLPRFGAATEVSRWKVLKTAMTVTVILLCTAAGVSLAADALLPILYSEQFAAAKALIPLQLSGDALRVGAMVMQAAMLSRFNVRGYVVVDVVFVSFMVAGAYMLIPGFGAAGASVAVVIAGVCAFVVAAIVSTRQMSK